ncbi:MAG: hypothetical protein QOE28_2702 [Solirubrobacteraceae bacterium]|jgi:hypothetical protein|nr:hypothetical protein [Solirubrobacteraceae bacterium]
MTTSASAIAVGELDTVCSRNASVTTAQIRWVLTPCGSGRQHLSRKNPVTGSVPHGSRGRPSTLPSGTP